MFEKTSELAEKLAASVSRRGFLGSLGGWAAAAALGVAGVLAGAGTARADNVKGTCCSYQPQPSGVPGFTVFFPGGVTSCPTCVGVAPASIVTNGKTCGECHTDYCHGCP
jgi:hypothetical protein